MGHASVKIQNRDKIPLTPISVLSRGGPGDLMEDIERQTRDYLKALYGLGTPAVGILPVHNLPAVLAFARAKRWIVEGPEGGHGLSPLGVKEIGE
jgi:hypothetical protein